MVCPFSVNAKPRKGSYHTKTKINKNLRDKISKYISSSAGFVQVINYLVNKYYKFDSFLILATNKNEVLCIFINHINIFVPGGC